MVTISTEALKELERAVRADYAAFRQFFGWEFVQELMLYKRSK